MRGGHLGRCLGGGRRLGIEAVADPEVGVDVAPAGRAPLELLAQLADEDIDGAITVGHRVAPDPLVDGLALEHLALGAGEQVEELELAPGEVEAGAADEGLELVGADLQLAGDEGAALHLRAAAPAPARHRFHAGHRLLGVAWLGDPVVDAEPQAADPLGDRRAAGADDYAEIGEHSADPLQVAPAVVAQHRRVDQDRAQLHRDQLLRGDRAGDLALLPPGGLRALREDRDETAVVVDHREPDGLLRVQVGAIVCVRAVVTPAKSLRSQDFHRQEMQIAPIEAAHARPQKKRTARGRWAVRGDERGVSLGPGVCRGEDRAG